jgi:hypothetical protein
LGTYFHLPWGLLALLAVPAILALHLFRRRFEPRVVSALFLWATDDHIVMSGRKREPLRSSVSLWSELLAATCLAFALAGPRSCGSDSARHLVVVLDDSASMAATPGGESAAARVRQALERRIRALHSADRVTVIESGALPRTLVGPGALGAEALERLAAWNPRSAAHDYSAALGMALQHAAGTRVYFYTDTPVEELERTNPLPAEVEVVALGRPAQNVAITQAQRITGAEEGAPERALLSVRSFAAATRTLELRLYAGTELLAQRALELAPGKSQSLALDLPAGAPPIEARLSADDFEFDDRAYLAPPPARGLALHVALDDDLLGRLGLRGASGAPRAAGWAALIPHARSVDDPAAAHLVLTSSDAPAQGNAYAVPPGGPTTWAVDLLVPSAETKAFVGPFLLERSGGLFEGSTWQGVIWSADPALRLPGAPLVTAGTTPLLCVEELDARRVYRMQIDATRSTLARSPDWPVWLANLAEARRAELPGAERTSLRVRERFVWRGERAATYRLEGPGEPIEIAAGTVLECEAPSTPGFWRLSADGRELALLGVSFADPRESDLARLGSGVRASDAPEALLSADADWPQLVLVALALAALLVDWWALATGARRIG